MPVDNRNLNLPKRAAAQSGASLALPEREEKILEFWERNRIFEKTLAKTRRGKPFVFYEGPPTANGSPGIHHFEARAFKDLIPRYKTMRGFHVERKAGWDTHGLPVEIEVEKQLGFKTKREIEKFGIEKFNATCRESVWRYKEEWDRFTKRIGFWLDIAHPYITYETSYIETLWWVIKEIWKKQLLYQDFKVVPWCPRCETALSTHELGQGYEAVKDRSVFVRFRVKAKTKEWQNTSILSWTTTPWTLPGNVALAINPKEDYVCVPDPDARGHWVLLGKKALGILIEKNAFPPEFRNRTMLDDIDVFSGRKLVGLEYEPLFKVRQLTSSKSYRVCAADFVTMEEGTGVVHTAVMYGDDDYKLGTKVGLPKFHTVDETGRFIRQLADGLGGQYVKDPKTEEKIIASLKLRGLLFKEELYEHDYPFCWRCETPVLYYARNAWWMKTTAKRKELIANSEKINWIPEHIKHGRFGEFLREVRDWAFSRERYWGTPLPVWQCAKCKHQEVIGSLEELSRCAPSSGNIYLAMRHGQAETQLLGIVDGSRTAFHLTPRGKKQVAGMARQLRKEKIDLIISSPVLRTQETAKILTKTLGVKVLTDNRLREIHIGVFERKPVVQYQRYFSSTLEQFTKSPPQGESLNDLKKRLMVLMQDLEKKYRGKRILLVSHEYPIWILWGAVQGLSNEATVAAREGRHGDFVGLAEVTRIPFRTLPRNDVGDVDLHRPFVDAFKFSCPKCRSAMQRVPEVVDVWFDSGAMPFAQGHWPFAQIKNSKLKIQNSGKLLYPADYICEAIDQTRGWFYTLLAVSTLLGRGTSYKNVISLGHVLDKHGQKMSKSKGNVVDPWAMIAKYGTDTIRWYFYTLNAPGDPKRFDEKDLLLKLRGTIATLWNSFVFFDTYVDKIKISDAGLPKSKNALDRWVLLRVDWYIKEVTRWLDDYNIVGAARLLEEFIVGEFSNWYIRRSRRRFQRPDSAEQKNEAAAVSAFVLVRVVELMAPFTPFLAEVIYQELKGKLGLREESVHLRQWPNGLFIGKQKLGTRDTETFAAMASVRWMANLALAQRAKAGIKIRQPLGELKISEPEYNRIRKHGFLDILKEEVNVKNISADPNLGVAPILDITLTSELREEGLVRELVRNIQEMRRDVGLKPTQKVGVQVIGDGTVTETVERWRKFVQREANAVSLAFGGKRSAAVSRDVVLGGSTIWLGIRTS